MAEFNAKPTNKKPISDQSKKYEKDFKKTTAMHNINLNEVDGMLNEKEMSLKKKIFSLPKMEALVHPDPKLSAVYNKMAEDGEEKYGYHYNETIMNIIFNDYVLNSPKYLQKYKMAIPKKKKRRDKSGIRQLQKAAEKKIEQSKKDDKEMAAINNQPNEMDETSTTGGVGGDGMGSGGYATPRAWGSGDLMKGGNSPMQRKPIWKGGTIIQESNYLLETDGFEKYYDELNNGEIENITDTNNIYENMNQKISTPEELKIYVTDKKTRTGKGLTKEDIPLLAGQALYNVAVKTADNMLPLPWEQLPDINSMWDYIDENGGMTYKNFIDAVKEAANDRLAEEGFSLDDLMETEINEKSTSKAQQRFMGMVRGLQKGNVSPNKVSKEVKKVAKEMKPKDVKDFAATKHDDLPEKVNEHHLNTKNDKVKFILTVDDMIEPKKKKTKNEFVLMYKMLLKWADDKIDNYYQQAEAKLNELGIDPLSIQIAEDTDQTMIGDNPETMANKPRPQGDMGGNVPMGMQDTGGLRESEDDGWWDDAYEKAFASMEDDDGNIFNPDVDNDINKNAHKMDWKKVKAQNEKPLRIDRFMKTPDGREMFESNNSDSEDFEQISRETEFDTHPERDEQEYEENQIFNEINEELEAFSIHQNKLKSIMEDKKPSSLVLKDRLGKENEANFKSDMKQSGTKDVTKMEKDIMWKDQQKEVGKNPYKAAEDIEKASIKATSGNALKNVGDSDGTKGEIPKRNLTTKEQEEVDEYRLGQQDLIYDNPPNEKFEERMKAGMGEDMYKKRQEKLKKRAEYPMYNKEEQPIGDTAVDKVQFDKEKSGWNERTGLKESTITGKFFDELNKKRLIDFELKNVQIVESINNMFKLDFTGMGNSIDSRGNVNEAVNNVLTSHKFYTDGKKVVAVKNPTQKLNEGEEKKKPIVNEEFNKMKHLFGYDPKKFVDTKRNKL